MKLRFLLAWPKQPQVMSMPRALAAIVAAMKTSMSQSKNGKRAGIKPPGDERESAENFQPRQIESQSHADRPRKHFVIIDVDRELKRFHRFLDTGVNEYAANNELDDAPRNVCCAAATCPYN